MTVMEISGEETEKSYSFTIRASGRLCLFGEHQDYLDMPVIATALPLYCHIHVQVKDSTSGSTDNHPKDHSQHHQCRIIELDVPPQLQHQNSSSRIRFDLDRLPPRRYNKDMDDETTTTTTTTSEVLTTVDFALAAIYEILDDGWTFPSHSFYVNCTSTSDIPLQAGCSSSTAFCVAWIVVLAHLTSSSSSGSILSSYSSSSSVGGGGGGATIEVTGKDPSTVDHPSQKVDQESSSSPLEWLQHDPIRLAQLAHRVEVLHFGSPGGTMDHVTIALALHSNSRNNLHHGKEPNNDDPWGGTYSYSSSSSSINNIPAATASSSTSAALRIGPGPWQVQHLPPLPQPQEGGVWILADSGQPKDTLTHLKRCKQDRLTLLHNELQGNWDTDFTTPLDTTTTATTKLTQDQQLLVQATKTNRDTEAQAAELWMSSSSSSSSSSLSTGTGMIDGAGPTTDPASNTAASEGADANATTTISPLLTTVGLGRQLGALMDRHHAALRDGLHLSTPRLEAMNHAAHEAGAWGFKLVGSGGGGCAVAWTSPDTADSVAQALQEAGAVQTWILS